MPDPTKHILLMDGPDSTGLIYHVTGRACCIDFWVRC